MIANRENKRLPQIFPYQFGFRNHRSTGQPNLVNLIQRKIDFHLCMTFFELKKTFDSIDKEVLIIALKDFGIPGYIISVIKALHASSIGKLDKDKAFVVNRGMRQECALGLLLFVILFDFLLSMTGGEKRNFACDDDWSLIADNQANATNSLNEIVKPLNWSLKLKVDNT